MLENKMIVSFVERNNYTKEIDFTEIKRHVKIDIEKIMPDDRTIGPNMIYSAFAKNPEHYLTKLGYLSALSDPSDNAFSIKCVVDAFFRYCMQDTAPSYYVLKGGEMLAKYEDPDMAKLYAHRMDGYVIKVE